MANINISLHTSEENIKQLDLWAAELRRSRNSIVNEGIEMVLNHYTNSKVKAIVARDTKKKVGRNVN